MDENDKDLEKFLPKWYLELLKMKKKEEPSPGN
jgi:hypothetical protein